MVQPSDLAFDNGERPLNLLRANMMWMNTDEFNWLGTNTSGAQVALLWGDLNEGALSGSMLKLPSGFEGNLWSPNDSIKAVTIQGELVHAVEGLPDATRLEPGGYFTSAENVQHAVSCESQSECLIYIRTTGKFRVNRKLDSNK